MSNLDENVNDGNDGVSNHCIYRLRNCSKLSFIFKKFFDEAETCRQFIDKNFFIVFNGFYLAHFRKPSHICVCTSDIFSTTTEGCWTHSSIKASTQRQTQARKTHTLL